jgi:Asp-tRNA(Asn)/Glu-tRNA(Gln) amidotransferase A subunit family amidase
MDGHVPPATGALSLGACIGPMARRIADLELLFEVIAQSHVEPVQLDQMQSSHVAFYVDDGIAPVTDETAEVVRSAAHMLSDVGFDVREERPPGISEGSRLWIELFADAARQHLREFYRGREDEAGPLVSAMLGDENQRASLEEKVDIAERRAKAVVQRERLREELLHWMKQTPLILAPVGATPAFEHGVKRIDINGKSISVFRAFSYSQTFNVFGLPAVAIPTSCTKDGLPIGVQLVGPPDSEHMLLAAASTLERVAGS